MSFYSFIMYNGVSKSRTWLSDFTFTLHFHALQKDMASHSSVLAWRIPGTEKPCGLLSMGLQSRTWLKRLSSGSSSNDIFYTKRSIKCSHFFFVYISILLAKDQPIPYLFSQPNAWEMPERTDFIYLITIGTMWAESLVQLPF